jgi:hypothetical protein
MAPLAKQSTWLVKPLPSRVGQPSMLHPSPKLFRQECFLRPACSGRVLPSEQAKKKNTPLPPPLAGGGAAAVAEPCPRQRVPLALLESTGATSLLADPNRVCAALPCAGIQGGVGSGASDWHLGRLPTDPSILPHTLARQIGKTRLRPSGGRLWQPWLRQQLPPQQPAAAARTPEVHPRPPLPTFRPALTPPAPSPPVAPQAAGGACGARGLRPRARRIRRQARCNVHPHSNPAPTRPPSLSLPSSTHPSSPLHKRLPPPVLVSWLHPFPPLRVTGCRLSPSTPLPRSTWSTWSNLIGLRRWAQRVPAARAYLDLATARPAPPCAEQALPSLLRRGTGEGRGEGNVTCAEWLSAVGVVGGRAAVR